MGQTPARYCQGRVASGRAVPPRRFRCHQHADGTGLEHPLLQPAWHPQTVRQGRQTGDQLDAPACKSMAQNEVRLLLHALAYNQGVFLQGTDLPEEMADWSLTSLQTRLIKIGARVVPHSRAITCGCALRAPM